MKTNVGKLQVVDEPEEVARVAATMIVEEARARPRVGLWLAGGSTTKRVCEVVAVIAAPQDFAGVHVWLVDDRPVPLEHPDSNGGTVLRLWGRSLGFDEDLGAGVHMPVARFHAMPCGRGVEKQIKEIEWALHELAGAQPRPDLTVLGVGSDGHVGGLMPGDSSLDAKGSYASARNGQQITATRALLAASRRLVFVVAGAAKADVAARVFGDPRALPAGMVALEAKAAGSDVTWLLDRAAVSRIA
jgi:6-phosphogluconolactonase